MLKNTGSLIPSCLIPIQVVTIYTYFLQYLRAESFDCAYRRETKKTFSCKK